jgi:hypothetical protein
MAFIRKRLTETKRGLTAHYQVLETYRQDGKVSQRVLCNLRGFSKPEEALIDAQRKKKWLEDNIANPRRYYITGRFITLRIQAKRKLQRLRELEKVEKKIKILQNVVSRLSCQLEDHDTTKT